MSKLFVVGIGPGDLRNMSFEAREAVEAAEVVVGYKTYLDLIEPLLTGKEVISSGMMREVERCSEALRIAASGRSVALVSSGDAGIYGMAGLVLELANKTDTIPPLGKGGEGGICKAAVDEIPLNPPLIKGDLKASPPYTPEIVIVPGVSALQAAAAVLGAPLMHDFAVISLSDLLTPWTAITKRVAAAAAADFVIAIYNPRSKGRVRQIEEARDILLCSRSAATPVGIVRNACRDGQERVVTTLAEMLDHPIDMFSLVIVGNSATFVDGEGRMVTPRGYKTGSTFYVLRSTLKNDNFEPRTSNVEPHQGKALMVCGTGSDVGKSVLTAGICRILRNRGVSVAPFKSQNMALNSAVTPEGGEIGRAQAVQAEACGIPPHTDMNPVLLKPNSDTGSQVILQGRVVRNMGVKEYHAFKPEAFRTVEESFARLKARCDFVVIEGAGSIAEINLKAHDIANLKVAEMAGSPVILVADIDRGGVFAQIVGTLELLSPAERSLIKGTIINKFRGDPALLSSGIAFVEQRTGVPVLGVVPYFTGFRLPEEDSVALQRNAECGMRNAEYGKINIGVVRLPRISNYTDFDALEVEPDVELRYIETADEVAGLDLLILPGSKSTMCDLLFLRERGFFGAIQEFSGMMAGICGGYQMLGRQIFDPHGMESDIREAEGLGLLDATTTILMNKETHQAEAFLLPTGVGVAPGCKDLLSGYEIHMGETVVGPGSLPFAGITCRSGREVDISDGAVSKDGRVFGTYLHGIFDNDQFRRPFLNRIREGKGLEPVEISAPRQDPFDLLAEHLESHLDMKRLLAICGMT